MKLRTFIVSALGIALLASTLPAAEEEPDQPDVAAAELDEARHNARLRGMDWLAGQQAADGSWGNMYTIAVTSFACLAHMAAHDEPFDGETGQSIVKGLQFLLSKQADGMFENQGHTWIHGQGFATLALCEAYGRTLICAIKPDIDTDQMKTVVTQAVDVIAKNQSSSGGWWYTPGNPSGHEGSTTCCAVQALVSADNFGIEIDQAALHRGFEYLKKCQNKDGGFDYQLGPGESSMIEGTAGGVATLGLMKKFDYSVMILIGI